MKIRASRSLALTAAFVGVVAIGLAGCVPPPEPPITTTTTTQPPPPGERELDVVNYGDPYLPNEVQNIWNQGDGLLPVESAQTFVAGISGVLDQISLLAFCQNSSSPCASNTITITIETVDPDGKPSGNVIGGATYVGPGSGFAPFADQEFFDVVLDTPATVAAGESYAITLSAGLGDRWFLYSNEGEIIDDFTQTGYADGKWYYRWAGFEGHDDCTGLLICDPQGILGGWTQLEGIFGPKYANVDLMFRTWVVPS